MKHEIEIEGLPEGWEPVAIRKQKLGEHIFCLDTGFVVPADHRTPKAHLIVKKKQPRRIVLEETNEENHLYESGQYAAFSAGEFVISGVRNKWREVKDIDGKGSVENSTVHIWKHPHGMKSDIFLCGDFTADELEQILTKMKELQDGKNNSV